MKDDDRVVNAKIILGGYNGYEEYHSKEYDYETIRLVRHCLNHGDSLDYVTKSVSSYMSKEDTILIAKGILNSILTLNDGRKYLIKLELPSLIKKKNDYISN